MATNVVSAVRSELVKAIKAKDSTVQTPAKWAEQAGFRGSAASPLRKFMARDSANGCGRTGRYPAMGAEELLETLDLAETFAASKEEAKRSATAKRISTKLRPAAVRGARVAKAKASQTGVAPVTRQTAKRRAEKTAA